ncbi:hypothetical protein [Paenibacillus sp. FSL R7-0179]|uniref:hypothetical protein n=1 Tax=Paenibacillus sp. FSL R7-0179 TaxID=2921672 RepID=UPI0030F85722
MNIQNETELKDKINSLKEIAQQIKVNLSSGVKDGNDEPLTLFGCSICQTGII